MPEDDESAPIEPEKQELDEIDLMDPLKREEEMPGLDPVIAIPPE